MKIFKILFVALAFFIISCGDDNTGTSIGQKAPIIKSKNTKGDITTLSKKDMEIVLFWESGCAGCISAMPHLNEYAKKNSMKIYAINSINKTNIIKDFEKSQHFSHIKILEDVLNISWDNYHINFVPSMFVLKDGIIVEKILGDRPWKHIESKLSKFF